MPRKVPGPPPIPRLNLDSLRTKNSVELDDREMAARKIPYAPWPEFYKFFRSHWQVGPPSWPNANVALVGMAGSGKTTLAREILMLRDRVCVFGTKENDPSLYAPFERQGYKTVSRWSPKDTKNPRVIFKPPLSEATAAGLAKQKVAFQDALLALFKTGGWTVYFDEVRYLSETLNLKPELNLLWLQGRSNGLVIVAATQRPVSVPLNMFEQSPHLFFWKIGGQEDRRTASSYAGGLAPTLNVATAILPRYECVYADTIEDLLVRTRVSK